MHFDNDVVVGGVLTDSEILIDEVDEEEDIQVEENFVPVSVTEARSALQNLRIYYTTKNVSERNIFCIGFNGKSFGLRALGVYSNQNYTLLQKIILLL